MLSVRSRISICALAVLSLAAVIALAGCDKTATTAPDTNMSNTINASNGFTDTELQDMETVDSKIQEAMSSAEFESLSKDEKYDKMMALLSGLYDAGLITQPQGSANHLSISFDYACGVSGGIDLTDWGSTPDTAIN